MSNQCIVEVRRFDDDVLVLIEDNYAKTFLSFEPQYFEENFGTLPSLLGRIAETDEFNGTFWIDEDERVVLDCCSSLEVHGLTDEVQVFLRSEQDTLGKL